MQQTPENIFSGSTAHLIFTRYLTNYNIRIFFSSYIKSIGNKMTHNARTFSHQPQRFVDRHLSQRDQVNRRKNQTPRATHGDIHRVHFVSYGFGDCKKRNSYNATRLPASQRQCHFASQLPDFYLLDYFVWQPVHNTKKPLKID